MIIKKISIKKFRGFENVEFDLGTHLTVISGQNGTQKTTILGMLSQPFSITDKDNPMINEKPLCGGTFKSAFSEKFKLSTQFDKPGEHEWTLEFHDGIASNYTVESMYRDKTAGTIRFWRKGDRKKGSGYVQLPVIYLSLKRLLPIGEDNALEETEVTLSEDESKFYSDWHNRILFLTRKEDKVVKSSYLLSADKQTLGVNTEHYDWKTNSAGQDNISKILLAILSFKRLKDNYKESYKGGILAIDEIDATLFSGSQLKLIKALIKFASNYKIQIIFTTHSLTILKEVSKLKKELHRRNQIKLMYLKKIDGKINIKNNIDYKYIEHDLDRTLTGRRKIKKIPVYTEDKEGAIFLKSLLSKKTKYLDFINISLGCGNLIQLASSRIPSFIFPNSLIVLDGDVRGETRQYQRANRIKNILLLPTDKSPEQIISQYLYDLPDEHQLWSNVDETFDHQYCFSEYSNDDIQLDRDKAKKWFNLHVNIWGRNASLILNSWKKENKEIVDSFIANFVKLYNDFAEKLEIDKL